MPKTMSLRFSSKRRGTIIQYIQFVENIQVDIRRDFSICLFELMLYVYFVALRPKSTAMVMGGRSANLTTLFSCASLNKWLTSTLCTYFRL